MKLKLIRSFRFRYLAVSIVFLAQFSVIPTASAATSGSGICQQTYTFSAGSESVVVTSEGNYCYVVFKNLGAAGSAASSYSWTKPSGISALDVLVIGGGKKKLTLFFPCKKSQKSVGRW